MHLLRIAIDSIPESKAMMIESISFISCQLTSISFGIDEEIYSLSLDSRGEIAFKLFACSPLSKEN